MAQTGQPYAYTGDDPVNGVDPMGLSWYNPSWAHKAAHRLARGAAKVGHFVAQHRRGLEQIGIAVAAVGVGIATAGVGDSALLSIAIGAGLGASASAASYAAGTLGVTGSGGFSWSGFALATGVGALAGGLGGAIGTTQLSAVQKSVLNIFSGGAIGLGAAEGNAALNHQGLDLGSDTYTAIGVSALSGATGDENTMGGTGSWIRSGFEGGLRGWSPYVAFNGLGK